MIIRDVSEDSNRRLLIFIGENVVDGGEHGGELEFVEFVVEEAGEDGFVGEVELVFADEKVFVHSGGGVLDEGVVLFGDEEEADGRVVVLAGDFGAVVVEVGVELARVLVAEGTDLEFDEDVALEDAVVEDEVDEEVVVADEESLLAGFEAEAVAEFEEEGLEVIEEGGFEFLLLDGEVGREAEEFEGVEVLGEMAGGLRGDVGLGESGEGFGAF